MKKNLLALVLCAASLASLTGCGNKGNNSSTTEKTRVQLAIEDAETMSREDLFKKAAEELGTTGKLKVLATTSRGGKDKVKNAFIAGLQKYNSAITDPLQYDTVVDGVIYTQLLAEITNGTKDGYSCCICQDGYQLQTKGLDTGYFQNYVPKEWKDATDTDLSANGEPFTLQYNFKTWMYNNANGDMNIDNVWDVTDSKFKGKIDTMDPNNENVNMDWLIQLTSDENVAALKSAYEASTANTDVKVDDYSSKGDKKYAYAFIDAFLKNAVFYEDDGKAMTHLAQTPGNIGWIVYSKILKVEETEAISKKDIVVASLGASYDGTNADATPAMQGFGGFMYKHYLQVMPDAQYPYAACAFLNLISTTSDAYSVWAGDVGDYPSMASINKDRSKGGHGTLTTVDGAITFTQSDTEANVFSCLNDPEANWWINKAGAIVETPSYIGPNYDNVIDFIDAAIANKK